MRVISSLVQGLWATRHLVRALPLWGFQPKERAMKSKILALAAAPALGTAGMTTSAMALGHGGGFGGHAGGFGGGHFGGGFAAAHPGGFAGHGMAFNGGGWRGGRYG